MIAIDVRGLGTLQRAKSAYVVDRQGHVLWPDQERVSGVSSQLVNKGMLHTYVTSEAALRPFQPLTRVRALRLRPAHFAPISDLNTDVQLGPTSAAAFRKAGRACRIVFLTDRP